MMSVIHFKMMLLSKYKGDYHLFLGIKVIFISQLVCDIYQYKRVRFNFFQKKLYMFYATSRTGS